MKKKITLLTTIGTAAIIAASAGLFINASNNIANADEKMVTITFDGTHNVMEYGDYFCDLPLINDNGVEVGTYFGRIQDYREGYTIGGDSMFSGNLPSYTGWRPSIGIQGIHGLRKVSWKASSSLSFEAQVEYDNLISDYINFDGESEGSYEFSTDKSPYSLGLTLFIFVPRDVDFTLYSVTFTYSLAECLASM